MKIVHMVPGSGGTFYCQNCMRDSELVRSLKSRGHDILMIPMYLPLSIDDKDQGNGIPIFYGAVNIYLEEKLSFFRLPFIRKSISKSIGGVSVVDISSFHRLILIG